MAILPILKKNSLVDKIIYPAPWFPNCDFLESKGIDFCAQNPSPVLSIRGYDLFKEVKQAGRLFPINCKSKIQAFQMDEIMLNQALDQQNTAKLNTQGAKKIISDMIEQSLDTKSGFKRARFVKQGEEKFNTPSTQVNVNEISETENLSVDVEIDAKYDQKLETKSTCSDLKSEKSIKSSFETNSFQNSKKVKFSKIEHYTESDINKLYSDILVTYKEFSKVLKINIEPLAYRRDKIEDKLAAPLFRENTEFQSEESSSEDKLSTNKSSSMGLTGIICTKNTPSSLRIENCVERIIGHKEEVIEDLLVHGGFNSSLDLSRRWLRRLRVRRWVEKIFCKNKEFCV